MAEAQRNCSGGVVADHVIDADFGSGGLGAERGEGGAVLGEPHRLLDLEPDTAGDAGAVVPAGVRDVGVLDTDADDEVVAVGVGEDVGQIE